jgi:hypothetical protein
MEKLGGEGKGQGWMEVKDQEGQGPLWAVAPLLMMNKRSGSCPVLPTNPFHETVKYRNKKLDHFKVDEVKIPNHNYNLKLISQ